MSVSVIYFHDLLKQEIYCDMGDRLGMNVNSSQLNSISFSHICSIKFIGLKQFVQIFPSSVIYIFKLSEIAILYFCPAKIEIAQKVVKNYWRL